MTSISSNHLENEILFRIQKNFPLVARPFDAIAKELHTTEAFVLSTLQKAKNDKIIRQTSAIFDTTRLGYTSSLVAFEIDPMRMKQAIEILNSHPGISHNYERNHQFNIWFTIAVAPDSLLGLDKTIELLAQLTHTKNHIILPTLKLYKIAVKLNTTHRKETKEKLKTKKFKSLTLTEEHFRLIKLLQHNIEFVSEPFAHITQYLNISYLQLFEMIEELQEAGVMRRYASILNHRKAGFNANAMVVWDIKEEQAEEIGQEVASFSSVSHCYLRPKYDNWQYNLFSMIHGKSQEETQSVIDQIKKRITHNGYMPLYSSREFKKVRICYFSDDFMQWELNHI